MADGRIEPIIGPIPELRNDICKILQDFGITTVHGKGFYNLTQAFMELIHNVLVAQKEEAKKKQVDLDRFLVGAYSDAEGKARLTLNHYNCDGDLTDNYIDIPLVIAIEKALAHLKECDASDE